MKLYTIGFTKKSAERFFGLLLLRKAGVTTLVDVRLNNVSQLAGFAKRDDRRTCSQRLGVTAGSLCHPYEPTRPRSARP
jgi:hypothetical protein